MFDKGTDRILALIPARGGSKGLPRKNILPFAGKPLIAWTISQALESSYIDNVIVSTDDEEIAVISTQYGAKVPYMRPAELATDHARVTDVITHTVEWLVRNNEVYNLILLLQPTSPLRTSNDINNAIELLYAKKAQAVVSVCQVEHHPYWSNVLPQDGCMKDFLRPEIVDKGRMELPVFYRLNGAIFLAYYEYLRTHNFYGEKTYAYIMAQEKSIDIDNRIDFKFAELEHQKEEASPCPKTLE